jgi:hypothetical protein
MLVLVALFVLALVGAMAIMLVSLYLSHGMATRPPRPSSAPRWRARSTHASPPTPPPQEADGDRGQRRAEERASTAGTILG